jgi:peptidoglycan hydrolase-like protein with peptidoglycan-binding domain
MKTKLVVITGLVAVLALFVAFAHAQQAGGQDSMMDQQQMDQQQALTQDPQTVMQVQRALSDRGYDPGAVDGKWKSDTESALMQFQQSQGMTASGQLDQQTLASLGVSGAAAGGQQDMSGQQGAPPDQSGAGGQQGGGY